MNTGTIVLLSVGGAAIGLMGLYFVFRDTTPPAQQPNTGGFQPYPQGAAPPQQDDTARAVGEGFSFAARLAERLIPSADERLRTERAAAAQATEQERFRACLANPTAPVCGGSGGAQSGGGGSNNYPTNFAWGNLSRSN